MLTRSELVSELERKAHSARRSGALVPLDTRVHRVSDHGIDFIVRVAQGLKQKTAANADRNGPRHDPFQPPYEADLYLGEVSRTHVALLNKFNVLDRHLLLITREDRPQTELLDESDFDALLRGLDAIDGIAFYNGGPEAGASQPHKHLQIVPLPLAEGDKGFPLQGLIHRPALNGPAILDTGFPLAVAPMPSEPSPATLMTLYRALWQVLGRSANGPDQPGPYNLLATRSSMWLVPRGRADYQGMGVNALGYAGALLVRDDEQLRTLETLGPMKLLGRVAGTPH
jgi:ATP adenylyltransferase